MKNAISSWADSLRPDARHAWRGLQRQPAVAAAAAGMLAVGIGISTAMFTIADAVILRPVPFDNPEQLARLYMGNVAVDGAVSAGGIASVTPGLFDMLGGERPIRGRLFDAAELRATTYDRVLLNEDVWRSLYHADPPGSCVASVRRDNCGCIHLDIRSRCSSHHHDRRVLAPRAPRDARQSGAALERRVTHLSEAGPAARHIAGV